MSCNEKNGPVCCVGKPCGDTCISAVEECHEGSGSATCSSNENCACNSCDSLEICVPGCGCGNMAAGDCTTGSCGSCCWDPQCSRHGWILNLTEKINLNKIIVWKPPEMKKWPVTQPQPIISANVLSVSRHMTSLRIISCLMPIWAIKVTIIEDVAVIVDAQALTNEIN